jgi:hypothetical protein
MTFAPRCLAARLRFVLIFSLLTLFASPLFGQTNRNGAFNATDGYVVVPHDAALDLCPTMTIEAWVKAETPRYSYGAVVDRNYQTGFSFGVGSAYPATDSAQIVLYLKDQHFFGPYIRSDSLTWAHIAVSVDTVAHRAVFYLDGAPTNTVTGNAVRFLNNAAELRIGNSMVSDQFTGMCDEIRVWNVVRTDAEIAALWQHEAKGNEPGLVAVYHFEDDRDTIAWNRAAQGGLNGSFTQQHSIIPQSRPSTYMNEHEFNDNFLNATPLGYGGAILEAAIAPGDTDCYKIFAQAGDILRIQTAAKNAGEQIDLAVAVYSQDSTKHITTYIGNLPSLNTGVSISGYRFIRIHLRSGSGGSYTLATSLNGFVQPDSSEPNNTMATATPLEWGSITHGTVFPGLDAGVAAPDTDWYSFTGVEDEIGVFPQTVDAVSSGSGFLSIRTASAQLVKSYPNSSQNVRFASTGTYYARMVPNEASCAYLLCLFKGLADINGMLYDPMTFGSTVYLLDGWNGAYDGAYALKVNNQEYTALPDYQQSECDGRQFCFAPMTMSGLTVSRKFFVPTAAQGDTLGFLRIQEILANTTAAPITVDVGIASNLGASSSFRVLTTSSGDSAWTPADFWAVTDDLNSPGDDPALTHIIDGPDAADRVDSVKIVADQPYWEWRDVTIQPGETAIYLYFVAQDSLPANALRKGPAFSGSVLPAAAKEGLSGDATKVRNWHPSALVSVNPGSPVPLVFALDQNYPNPFNPRTTIRAQWPALSDVQIAVYDILGRRVATVANGRYPAASYEFVFDASYCASGVYMYRIEARGENRTWIDVKKMVLLK